ncbi:MAG: hypothetical protein HQ402_00160 [Parcubacteria group bacterium]|nr:hypothetical protein [Parcubacteria group bacterium]
MTQVRVKGYVVGFDKSGDELLWTVKVKDPTSAHDNKKFPVASMHQGSLLTKPGVDVTFKVEPVQVGQEQVLKAVDVSLGFENLEEEIESDEASHQESIGFALVEEGDLVYVWPNECKSRDEAEEWLKGMSEECKLCAFFRVHPGLFETSPTIESVEDATHAFEALRSMARLNSFRDTLAVIVMEAFALGQKHKP